MPLYPYLYPYGGYPYGGYPYGTYLYSGLYNNFKIDSLLNEYDELNQLAIQNHDIYVQNMLDDCKECSRDISGNIIHYAMHPPMDGSHNVMHDIDFNVEPEFPTPPHYPSNYPNYREPFHHPPYYPPYYRPPFHHPPYYPPYYRPPYYPPYYPHYRPPYRPPYLYREPDIPQV
jgi:hypothetical protein